jgi:succinoglycan biosynthesis transport protein ExoP
MSFTQFLIILRARYKLILKTFASVVILTLVGSFIFPKKYTATASLVMNYKGVDPVTGLTLPAQLMPGYIPTQADIITSKRVAIEAIDELKLADSPVLKEDYMKDTDGQGDIKDWIAELLLKKLEVIPSRDSSVLDVNFNGNDPQFAAAVANAFADAYLKTTIELKVDPVRKATTFFNGQIKQLRDNLEKAQANLSTYQKDHQIVSVDDRLDVETARLNELSTQLVQAQGQLMEATSRKQGAQGNNAIQSPDVISNPLVQNLKNSLAQAEVKFAQISQNYGVNHPQYQASKAEVEKLRAELANSVAITSGSLASNASILGRRTADIKNELEKQKEKILTLNKQRNELAVLAREVDSAQRAFDVATQRLSQSDLEGRANLADVSILNYAIPPSKAASPKVLLNTILSIFLGGLLGIGLALALEVLDKRIRSEQDLVDELETPFLGSLSLGQPKLIQKRILRLPFATR